MVSLSCESVSDLSGYSSLRNISDNIHTDMVSLSCEFVNDLSGDSSVQNISHNIHTDNGFSLV